MAHIDWRTQLADWLRTNPKTMPPELEQLRRDFVARFPPDRLSTLTLEDYCLGLDSFADSFCYWLEWKTSELGSVKGGSAKKWGVYWRDDEKEWYVHKQYASPQEAVTAIAHGLQALVDAVHAGQYDRLDTIGAQTLGQDRNSLRQKPLHLYFPDQFLPITSKDHLAHFLRLFGRAPHGDLVALNRQLLAYLRAQPEFAAFDTLQLSRFLYAYDDPRRQSETVFKHPALFAARLADFVDFFNSDRYAVEERDYKDEVLTALGDVLRADGSLTSVQFTDEFLAVLKSQKKGLDNLTDRRAVDDFRSMLEASSDNRIVKRLHELLDDDQDLDARVGAFKSAIDRDYAEILQPSRTKNMHYGLITLFLAAYAPDRYMIYRYTTLKAACSDWGMDCPSDGEDWYSSLMQWAQPIRTALQGQLGSDIDWVDVHSFLWFNYNYYDREPAAPDSNSDQPMIQSTFDTAPPIPPELRELSALADRTRNIILYGPPGTGKTWLANHFAVYRLLRHNLSPQQADDYWQAVSQGRHRDAHDLRRLVTTEPLGDRRFWWATANPAHWSWAQLAAEGTVFFKVGRIEANFEEVQVGDYVFGYSSSPDKKLMTLARVVQDLHTTTVDGADQTGITLAPVQDFTNPLSWSSLKQNAVLELSEPVRNGARGTLFALSAQEVSELSRLLRARANELSLPSISGGRFVETVTFHQSMAYEDFIEGLRPLPAAHAGGLDYQVMPGIFQQIARIARAAYRTPGDAPQQYILLIDEINRANIAKVFGELITLLEDDKRLGQPNQLTVTLPYSRADFGIPPNLLVIGTMNTADRSIALLDVALRRRFTFLACMPDPRLLDQTGPGVIADISLRRLLHNLNRRLHRRIDADHQIGHSYFMGVADLTDLHHVWYHKIIPLLQEYFYHDGARLRAVIGPAFVSPDVAGSAVGSISDDEFEFDNDALYLINELHGDAFARALHALAAGDRDQEDL